MNKTRQTKIILTGDYHERQIRALSPNFILTQEAQQFPDSKVKNASHIDIKNISIKKTDKDEIEVTVDWNEK
jgi:hypothetical protein